MSGEEFQHQSVASHLKALTQKLLGAVIGYEDFEDIEPVLKERTGQGAERRKSKLPKKKDRAPTTKDQAATLIRKPVKVGKGSEKNQLPGTNRFLPEEVEHNMNYAKAGGRVPVSLQGIFWMDQRGSALPLPGYNSDYVFMLTQGYTSVHEVTASFGEGGGAWWDQDKQCLWGVSRGNDHWAFTDTVSGRAQLQAQLKGNVRNGLCFLDENTVAITHGHDVPSGDYVMEKKPWGWIRRTNIVKLTALEIFPPFIQQLLPKTIAYPLIQIVDGMGKRTIYYEKYLQSLVNINTSKCTASKKTISKLGAFDTISRLLWKYVGTRHCGKFSGWLMSGKHKVLAGQSGR